MCIFVYMLVLEIHHGHARRYKFTQTYKKHEISMQILIRADVLYNLFLNIIVKSLNIVNS